MILALVTGHSASSGAPSVLGWSGGSTVVAVPANSQYPFLYYSYEAVPLTNNRADLVVHLLGLGLVDDAAVEGGAGRGVVQALETIGLGHLRVLMQVVVVIGRSSNDRACLAGLGEIDVGM